ncbi:hypothetical protein [Brunnivagina elsteri]|nr:hypothetical protein [Calothrix elsteri]
MLFNKFAAIGLLGFSASALLVGNPVLAQTVNQEINQILSLTEVT